MVDRSVMSTKSTAPLRCAATMANVFDPTSAISTSNGKPDVFTDAMGSGSLGSDMSMSCSPESAAEATRA